MYGTFTYIWLTSMVNVGKYSIHGWYGCVHPVHLSYPHSWAESSFIDSLVVVNIQGCHKGLIAVAQRKFDVFPPLWRRFVVQVPAVHQRHLSLVVLLLHQAGFPGVRGSNPPNCWEFFFREGAKWRSVGNFVQNSLLISYGILNDVFFLFVLFF